MTILFMGGELGAFTPSDSDVIENTNSANYNSTFARAAIFNGALAVSGSPVSYAESAAWSSTAAIYTHFEISGSGASTSYGVVELYEGTTAQFQLKTRNASGNRELQMQYKDNAAAWQNAGTTVTIPNTLSAIDLFTDITNGVMTLYVGGTERLSVTGLSLGHMTGITKLRWADTRNPCAGSQFIVATEPTIGWRLLTRYPSGAGATGDWTGDYTSVDEAVNNDADFILSATANQVETFTQTGPAITGYVVRAVAVAARAKRGASGPANLQLALRVSGTDYFSGSKSLGLGYGAYEHIWETNPATAADWLNTAIDAVQPGVKSIT